MRIISGKLKGKSINFVKSLTTRPLKDSVKENIFNILTHSNLFKINLEKSYVLDLYSGIGSFGIECISRGAAEVTFVEKDKIAINTLKKNLFNLSIQNKSSIFEKDIADFLNKDQKKKFEIFFLDPPFKDNEYQNYLELITKQKIFKKNHIVILHREKKTSEDINKSLNPLLIKEYGRSKIIFGQLLL